MRVPRYPKYERFFLSLAQPNCPVHPTISLVLPLIQLFPICLNLVLRSPLTVAYFMMENHPNHVWSFDPRILILVLFWPMYVFYDYSSFISVFLALVRCVCVARPLQFKSMFTTSRTVAILVVLFFVSLTLRAPVLTIFHLTWAVNPRTNSTWRYIGAAENFVEIYKANDVFNRNIILWVCYFSVIACVIIFASNIRAASKFRQSLQRATPVGSTANQTSHKAENHSTVCLPKICRLFNRSF